jgi:NitT/TauT family transport system ATP-binding protein
MAVCISINHVSKSFDDLKVLDNWSLTINKAERISLLGPSGSGKTTFLRLIAGLEAPDSGKISSNIDKTAFVFQEPRLIPWRNVRDNLLFVRKDADVPKILKELRMDGFEEYFPAQLSGGMQQRVNLARALVTEPDLLILDEAFTSLDLPVKLGIMQDLLNHWRKKRFSIVSVTHDLKEALLLSDRILILSQRPAHIAHNFPVELEGDRSFSDPKLLQLESKLLELLSLEIRSQSL